MSTDLYVAIAAYLAAFALRFGSLWRTDQDQASRPWICQTAGVVAVFLHAFVLFKASGFGAEVNFSFLHTLSLVMLLVNGIIVLSSAFRVVDQPAIITFPLAAGILALGIFFPEPLRPVHRPESGMTLHILSSLLAFSFLAVASIQALLVSIQDACLRRRTARGPILRSLPSLESMENLMFQLLIAGTSLLTLSLISGFVFLEDMFAQHLAHKTILSIMAWFLLCALLLGRRFLGWRGITAVRWTLAGFAALTLGYFGSKFVIELILKRG